MLWYKKLSSDVGFEPTRQLPFQSFQRIIGRLRPLGQSDIRWFRGLIRESECSLNLSWNNKNEGLIPGFRLVGRFEY